MAEESEDAGTETGADGRDPTKLTAAELEAGYTINHRIYELVGIGSATGAFFWAAHSLLKLSGTMVALEIIPAAIIAMLCADLVSGLVHWGFDTWGTVNTPVVGRLAIRTFRHHHVDPRAMLNHDFVETNGHNMMLSLPFSIGILWRLRESSPLLASPDGLSLGSTILTLAIFLTGAFIGMTSQIHKWAHHPSPPRVVRMLQRAKFVLGPEHHGIHHAAPHDTHYCITAGWLNAFLAKVYFFRIAEALITKVTGVKPRTGTP